MQQETKVEAKLVKNNPLGIVKNAVRSEEKKEGKEHAVHLNSSSAFL